MALERDFDLLDDYLSDRLNEGDRSAFEKKVEADPELKQELKFQQDLVEGIRKARTVELKSMLNNVPIVPVQGGQTSFLVKAGSWVVITGLVVTGLYLYFSENESVDVVKEPAPVAKSETNPGAPAENESTTPEEIKTKELPESKEKKADQKSAETNTTSSAAENKPELKVYHPSKEASDDEAVERYEQEQLEIISKAFVTSSIEVETENTNRKYTFHYVFRGGKLILYGAFEKHLYEILEFISDDKRTVVLFYRANYYLLDINKTTPTMLTPIKDRKLLKKLSEYRGD